MSNVKKLKKEVGNITYEVVSDCFTYLLVNEEKNKEKVLEIISEAINLRNNIIQRINNSNKDKKPKEIKNYYSDIRKDLSSGMDKAFEKLSKLSKK